MDIYTVGLNYIVKKLRHVVNVFELLVVVDLIVRGRFRIGMSLKVDESLFRVCIYP